jgi:hypothetical protein
MKGVLMPNLDNHIATPADWRAAARAGREARAERLCLPSGAIILAAKPEPLEWILSGRLPQGLLAAALEGSPQVSRAMETELSREEILELARFATQLVLASVVKPHIGNGPGEIPLEEIPIEDRAFIFEWACRSLGQSAGNSPSTNPGDGSSPSRQVDSDQEDLSSVKLERFRKK